VIGRNDLIGIAISFAALLSLDLLQRDTWC
jgi:hypothetical protein